VNDCSLSEIGKGVGEEKRVRELKIHINWKSGYCYTDIKLMENM
jgi:hypothetical protein